MVAITPLPFYVAFEQSTCRSSTPAGGSGVGTSGTELDVGLRGASDDVTLIEWNKGGGGSAIAEREKVKSWRGNEDDKAGESETRNQQTEKK